MDSERIEDLIHAKASLFPHVPFVIKSNISEQQYYRLRALEIPDNLDVGRHDPARLPAIVADMDYAKADVIVLSACVQMPSLPAIAHVEALTGKPVVTAAVATTYAMLRALDLEPVVPGAGALLSGTYA